MGFHEFGHDFVFACDFGLELLDGGVLGIVDGFGLSSIFKEFSLPSVEEGGCDAELIADRGDGYPFEQVPLERGDLIVGREMATFAVHVKPPFR